MCITLDLCIHITIWSLLNFENFDRAYHTYFMCLFEMQYAGRYIMYLHIIMRYSNKHPCMGDWGDVNVHIAHLMTSAPIYLICTLPGVKDSLSPEDWKVFKRVAFFYCADSSFAQIQICITIWQKIMLSKADASVRKMSIYN